MTMDQLTRVTNTDWKSIEDKSNQRTLISKLEELQQKEDLIVNVQSIIEVNLSFLNEEDRKKIMGYVYTIVSKIKENIRPEFYNDKDTLLNAVITFYTLLEGKVNVRDLIRLQPKCYDNSEVLRTIALIYEESKSEVAIYETFKDDSKMNTNPDYLKQVRIAMRNIDIIQKCSIRAIKKATVDRKNLLS